LPLRQRVDRLPVTVLEGLRPLILAITSAPPVPSRAPTAPGSDAHIPHSRP